MLKIEYPSKLTVTSSSFPTSEFTESFIVRRSVYQENVQNAFRLEPEQAYSQMLRSFYSF